MWVAYSANVESIMGLAEILESESTDNSLTSN
jgi:hypothetical protein